MKFTSLGSVSNTNEIPKSGMNGGLSEEQGNKIVTPQEIQKVYEQFKSQGKEFFTREEFFQALNEL